MKAITLLLLLGLILPVSAKSPVWQVSKGNNFLYIGGTVHVLGNNDYPLPPAFEEAYNNSKKLIFEIDINKMESPEIQMLVASKMKYSDGSTLKDHLKPETYATLKEYLKPLGIPVITFEDFKPSLVSLMLTMMELQKLGIAGIGVDKYYNSKATQDYKSLGKLETIEEQINFLTKMGDGDPDEYILYTLNEIEELSETFTSLKDAWRNGDTDKLAEIAITPLNQFPDIYEMLIVKRNNAWVPQIEAMLKTKEVEMILVGALHLAGKDSVLKQLESRGYTVEQFQVYTELPRVSNKYTPPSF